MITIYHHAPKFIKNLLLIVVLLPAISFAKAAYEIKNPKGETITLRLATNRHEHAQGLSGIKALDFARNEGMLFVNETMGTRRFWMPDTFFNLDIIFLDSDLKVVALEMNAPMHPGLIEPPVIFRTKSYQAQFVLETHAGVSFTKDLKAGDDLKWVGTTPIIEIVKKAKEKK